MILFLTERGQDRYDIFTAEKGATYLIYGWVRFLEITNEEIKLIQKKDIVQLLEVKNINHTEVFFFQKVTLANDITISICFKSNFTDSAFHIYEL